MRSKTQPQRILPTQHRKNDRNRTPHVGGTTVLKPGVARETGEGPYNRQPLPDEQRKVPEPRTTNILRPEPHPQTVIQILPTPAPILVLVMPGATIVPPTRPQPTQTPEAPAHTPLATGHCLPTIDRVFHSPVKPVDMTGNPALCNTPTQEVRRHLNTLQPIPSLNPSTNKAYTTLRFNPRKWQETEFQNFRFRRDSTKLRREKTQTTFTPFDLACEKTCGEIITRTMDPEPETRSTTPFYCSQ